MGGRREEEGETKGGRGERERGEDRGERGEEGEREAEGEEEQRKKTYMIISGVDAAQRGRLELGRGEEGWRGIKRGGELDGLEGQEVWPCLFVAYTEQPNEVTE